MSSNITVEICRAVGLKRTITLQPPNSFARIHSLADPNVSFSTTCKSKTTKPVWNERFDFNLKEGESLEINVWDRRDKNALGKLFAVSDRFLGSARLTPKLVEKFIDAGEFNLNLDQSSRHTSKLGGHLIIKLSRDLSQVRSTSSLGSPLRRPMSLPKPQETAPASSLPKSPSTRTIHSTLSNKVFHVVKVDEDLGPAASAAAAASPSSDHANDDGVLMMRPVPSSSPPPPPSPLPDASGYFAAGIEEANLVTNQENSTLLNEKIRSRQQSTNDEYGSETIIVYPNEAANTKSKEQESSQQPVFCLVQDENERVVEQAVLSRTSSSKHMLVPQLSLPARLVQEEEQVVLDESSRKSSEANILSDGRPSIVSSSMNESGGELNNTSSGSGDIQGVKKSFQSLKVPILGRVHDKPKKKLSFQGSGVSIASSDLDSESHAASSHAGSLTSSQSMVRSTESIYDGFKKEELNALAEKCKKFNYDLLNYGEKVTIFKLSMSRENAVEDSYCFLTNLKSAHSRTQFLIKFSHEEGVDYGGVGKEWFHLLSSEIFKPSYGLFVVNPQNNQLDINIDSIHIIPEHKSYYKFIGQMLGLALYNNYHVDVSLDNLIFKHLLDEPIDLEDLKFYDFTMFNSLKWISENDVKSAELMYSFTADYNSLDGLVTVELIDNGREIDVTDENKLDFINAYVDWKLNKSIRTQLESIKEGFYQIIPKELMHIFTSNDLQLVVCGLDTIEVSKWKANSVYRNCTQYTKQVIWFWRAVETLDNERRRKLLQLVTGSSRLPIKEFGDNGIENSVPFTIALLSPFKNTKSLPIINTCFNRISLPCYETYDKLLTKLRLMIDETREFSVQ